MRLATGGCLPARLTVSLLGTMILGGNAGRHRRGSAIATSTRIIACGVEGEVRASFGLHALPARVIVLPPSVIAGRQMTLGGSHLRAVGVRVRVGDSSVQVLDRNGFERYLGRKLCLGEYHQSELSNRLRAAWAVFAQYRDALQSRHCSFETKAKLFRNRGLASLLVWLCMLDADGGHGKLHQKHSSENAS